MRHRTIYKSLVQATRCCGGGFFEWTFDLPTGEQQKTPFTADAQTYTPAFWRFTPATIVLELPNGLVATYELLNEVNNITMGRLTELNDAFDNSITFGWLNRPGILGGLIP